MSLIYHFTGHDQSAHKQIYVEDGSESGSEDNEYDTRIAGKSSRFSSEFTTIAEVDISETGTKDALPYSREVFKAPLASGEQLRVWYVEQRTGATIFKRIPPSILQLCHQEDRLERPTMYDGIKVFSSKKTDNMASYERHMEQLRASSRKPNEVPQGTGSEAPKYTPSPTLPFPMSLPSSPLPIPMHQPRPLSHSQCPSFPRTNRRRRNETDPYPFHLG